jgi:hypothetical protein
MGVGLRAHPRSLGRFVACLFLATIRACGTAVASGVVLRVSSGSPELTCCAPTGPLILSTGRRMLGGHSPLGTEIGMCGMGSGRARGSGMGIGNRGRRDTCALSGLSCRLSGLFLAPTMIKQSKKVRSRRWYTVDEKGMRRSITPPKWLLMLLNHAYTASA